jgi:peptide/nickel transport system permease protein
MARSAGSAQVTQQPTSQAAASLSALPGNPHTPEPGVEVAAIGQSEGPRSHSLSATFAEHKMAVVGLGFLIFMVLFCFAGPLLYHTNQVAGNIIQAAQPPSSHHILGTDQNGFDILGRLMVGGQTSLEVGLGAAALGALFGVLWGATAGYVGGIVDSVMMRLVDALLSIPALLLLLVLATIVQPDVITLIFIVALYAWLVPARLIRAETLKLKDREFVEAAKICGARRPRLLLRHIIPNSAGTIAVNATFQVADAIILVAYLNFLGLGIPPPATNWGAMLAGGLTFALSGYWWMIYPPGIAIILTVMSVNYIGDGLRDVFDTRLRHR